MDPSYNPIPAVKTQPPSPPPQKTPPGMSMNPYCHPIPAMIMIPTPRYRPQAQTLQQQSQMDLNTLKSLGFSDRSVYSIPTRFGVNLNQELQYQEQRVMAERGRPMKDDPVSPAASVSYGGDGVDDDEGGGGESADAPVIPAASVSYGDSGGDDDDKDGGGEDSADSVYRPAKRGRPPRKDAPVISAISVSSGGGSDDDDEDGGGEDSADSVYRPAKRGRPPRKDAPVISAISVSSGGGSDDDDDGDKSGGGGDSADFVYRPAERGRGRPPRKDAPVISAISVSSGGGSDDDDDGDKSGGGGDSVDSDYAPVKRGRGRARGYRNRPLNASVSYRGDNDDDEDQDRGGEDSADSDYTPVKRRGRGRGRARGYRNRRRGTRSRPRGYSNRPLNASGGRAQRTEFTTDVIHVEPGEDIASELMALTEENPITICVMSASGSVSNPSLCQAANPSASYTHEGLFDIVTLSGSFSNYEVNGVVNISGKLTVTLVRPDGHVLGGVVVGQLVAASHVEVIVGSFVEEKKTRENSGNNDLG